MSIQSASYVLSARSSEHFVRDGRPQVAFVGRSNVGKSSLLNRLLGRKALARTSSNPGRTQAINYFLIENRYYFVDLPGYGYAKVSRTEREEWARFIDAYFQEALREVSQEAPLQAHVLQLVDAKVGATPLDIDAAQYFADFGAEPTIVATKIDKVPRGRRVKALAGIRSDLGIGAAAKILPFSAKTGEGTKELWNEINAYLNG